MSFYKGAFFSKISFRKMVNILKNGFETSIRIPRLFINILTYALSLSLIFIVLYLWTIAMKSNFGSGKMSFYWYLVVVLSFGASFMGSRLAHSVHVKSTNQISKNLYDNILWKWILAITLLIAGMILALGIFQINNSMNVFIFILALSILNIGHGFLQPANDTLINNFIPVQNSQERATVLSFSSMLMEVFLICFLIPLFYVDGKKIVIGWMIPAVLLIVTVLVANRYMKKYLKNFGTNSLSGPMDLSGEGIQLDGVNHAK